MFVNTSIILLISVYSVYIKKRMSTVRTKFSNIYLYSYLIIMVFICIFYLFIIIVKFNLSLLLKN